MGKRKYPPLTPGEVAAILGQLGFSLKRQDGSHQQWERLAASGGETRRLVTVDVGKREFWEDVIKSMIRQAGVSREVFYGATKSTARKIGLAVTTSN